MKSKKLLVIVIGLVAVLILMVALYPTLAKKEIEKRTYDFLFADGYTTSEIASVDVRHSYIGGVLGYGQWHTSIFFNDEPNVEYQCILSNDILPEVTAISAGGFSSNLPDDYKPLHYPQ